MKKTVVGAIVIVLLCVGGLFLAPGVLPTLYQQRDLEILHEDYMSFKEYAEADGRLEMQLFLYAPFIDSRTYSDKREGALIRKACQIYSNYADNRYEYYKNQILNADYSTGYRYDSNDLINDMSSFDPLKYLYY